MLHPRGQRVFQGVQLRQVLSQLSHTDELPCRYSVISPTTTFQVLTMRLLSSRTKY